MIDVDVYVRFRHLNGEERVFRDQVPGPIGSDFDLEVIDRLCKMVTPDLTSSHPPVVDRFRTDGAPNRQLRAFLLRRAHGIEIIETTVDNRPYLLA